MKHVWILKIKETYFGNPITSNFSLEVFEHKDTAISKLVKSVLDRKLEYSKRPEFLDSKEESEEYDNFFESKLRIYVSNGDFKTLTFTVSKEIINTDKPIGKYN